VSVVVALVGFVASPWLLSSAWAIIGCTAALLAGYCGAATLGAVVCRRPRVEIGPDGFVTYGLVGHRSRRWTDIEGRFAVIRVGLQSAVAYRLAGDLKESARIRPATSPAGSDETILICGELAMGAGQLADVLNQWKDGLPGVT
jgi:hypothetical protein